MLIYSIIGLNIGMILLLLISISKQFFQSNTNERFERNLRQQFNTLSQQFQSSDREARENVLIKFNQLQQVLLEKLAHAELKQMKQSGEFKEQLQHAFADHRARFDERQIDMLKILQETLQKGGIDNRQHVKEALADYGKVMSNQVELLTQTTASKLNEINQHVEKRLVDGFVKTNETFHDVIKRLALIDAAQKKITELSSSVINLQELLNDKRSRGTFGEVQLSAIIRNIIPEQHFSFQHLLSNNRRPDCMLFLPEPTGNIAIDAKFPLENFKVMIDQALPESEKLQAEKQFKIDIKKHITDIADKYIIPGETSDGAVMFIPAEAVFSEIHARHSDLVEFAHKTKVWLVSPTTMMAILTTARAVLKDAATRKQVHEIQQHLRLLSDDFERFQLRMDTLAKHIAQAHADVEQVHISSRKISQRFTQIEQAELEKVNPEPSLIQGIVPLNQDGHA